MLDQDQDDFNTVSNPTSTVATFIPKKPTTTNPVFEHIDALSNRIIDLQKKIESQNESSDKLTNDTLLNKITELSAEIKNQAALGDEGLNQKIETLNQTLETFNKKLEEFNNKKLENINNKKPTLTKTMSITGSNGGSKKSIFKASKKNLHKGGKISRKNNKKNRTFKKQKNKSILSK